MSEFLDLDKAVRKVPDFPKPGVLFYDITSILLNSRAFRYCVDRMVELYSAGGFDAVAAIEARGFIFAAPFADRLGLPLVPLRKKGKLPGKTIGKEFSLEYGTDEIQVHVDDIEEGWKLLLVDDLIATGGTTRAAVDLLLAAGGAGVEVFAVIGLPFLKYDTLLDGISVTTLIDYNSE